jgi:hypothetical protein
MELISRRVDYDIYSLNSKYKNGSIRIKDLNNSSENWTVSQKKAYVESVILGFPSSPFLAIYDKHGNVKIVDGVKRFQSIMEFLNDDFAVFPELTKSEPIFETETIYSHLAKSMQFKIEAIVQTITVHEFANFGHAEIFEQRLHSDFELLGRKVTVIDKCISFGNDDYLEGLMLISEFNQFLMSKYPSEDISIKIQQEDKIIRLIVETDGVSKVECERILDEFEKQMLHRLHDKQSHSNKDVIINLTNTNTVSNDISFGFKETLTKTNGLINQLIEEVESEPDLQKKLAKIVKSSNSVSKPEDVPSSSFLSRLSEVLDQAKSQGTTLNSIMSRSKECADLVKKIAEHAQSFSGLFQT